MEEKIVIKMMIVEDETILREGIRRVGDWESCGVEICGLAGNGIEALQQIEECRPDVILTDVVMPVMDGIALTKQVHEQYPDIRVIILSGHEEFQYVQSALEYKASGYLLKPAQIEKIMEAVAEVREEILKERKRLDAEKELQEKLRQSIPVLREHYMNRLISGIEDEEKVMQDQFEFLKIGLLKENLAVFVCENDEENEEKDYSGIANLQLSEVCKEVIGSEYRCCVFTDIKDRIVVIINYPMEITQKDALIYLEGKATRIQNEMEERWGKAVSIGIGRFIKNIRHLTKAYKEAEYALSYRFFMGRKSIIYIGDIEREDDGERFYLEQTESELATCIKTGDIEGTGKQTEQYFQLLKQCFSREPDFIYEEIMVFISNLIRSLRGKEAEGGKSLIKGAECLLKDLRKGSYATLAELQEKVGIVLLDMAGIINNDRLMRSEGLIDKAKKYVQENLSGNISLIAVADHVYVSPNYLSFLFKENGENFKDYVLRVKMQKAEEMMQSEKYNLSQIAAALGYKDGRYLSQVYKKYKGE